MLLEMRFSNFFSIKDEICIDFKAGNINTAGAKELSDNIFSFNFHNIILHIYFNIYYLFFKV